MHDLKKRARHAGNMNSRENRPRPDGLVRPCKARRSNFDCASDFRYDSGGQSPHCLPPQSPMRILPFICFFAWLFSISNFSVLGLAHVQAQNAATSASSVDFFETHIRPALIEHCQECHSTETEASGGLLLDSRAGWEQGGDSGPSIVPGQATESRFLTAISYNDPNLQMPPDGKLPQDVYDAFATWINDGAFDPREAAEPPTRAQMGLPVERAKEHWAYRDLSDVELPPHHGAGATSPIDLFINHRLHEAGLEASPPADRDAMVRRLAFDLTGLPPTEFKLLDNPSSASLQEDDYRAVVDRLLESPHFGETFARNWMDVARYAESITLRGFVLPEAWRYRDYLIQAFTEDRPFNQMICEQVAGDLMDANDLQERHMQLTATAFLAMGNSNLEQQDKTLLEMDYVDEQLEVIGRAFLGQTIGCARCHDHKFDPIPTRDYYALAGILRSAVALRHANLSRWIEQPLPLSEADEKHFTQLNDQLTDVTRCIASLKKKTNQTVAEEKRQIPVAELPGVVVDSSEAKLVGEWTQSSSVGRFIGDGYIHDGDAEKGKKTATFEPQHLPPGEYQVRLAYSASSNRASQASVRVFSADGEATVRINQREVPPDDALWVSLGEYRFEKDGQAFVLVNNEGSDGHVIVDAVQFLPLHEKRVTPAADVVANPANDNDSRISKQRQALLRDELKELESQRKALEVTLTQRPQYLTIVEEASPVDLPIHIRGDVHNLGERVPRGFLTAINESSSHKIDKHSSGRLELAHWIASDRNPLTARVYANRIWYWLMGQGLVPSLNNFGTTGMQPTHPELLDWLAGELIHSGWSTKHLARQIVLSDAYQRRITQADERQAQIDPANQLYWRGHSRRLTAESLRDSMLKVSGELDLAMGGSLIRPDTKADYGYVHQSTRRSLYQPLFRNSLPQLYEAFDFADSSVPVGQRSRSTVATQALVLLNHPWVAERAAAAAARYREKFGDDSNGIFHEIYQHCFYRSPTAHERSVGLQFMQKPTSADDADPLSLLIHSLFASLDFRYLD